MKTPSKPLAFGELPQPRLDDDPEAVFLLEMMPRFTSGRRRARIFATAARAYAAAGARGLTNE